MPLYEFECKKCGHKVEEICKVDTKTLACPECSARMARLISKPSISFKGGGWGRDGYFKCTDVGK